MEQQTDLARSRPRTFDVALYGACGVAAAAFGAHGVERIATADGVRWWAIAASIQLVTAPALLALTLLSDRVHRAAKPLLFAGSIIFCGSLYAMTFGAPRVLGAITPLGGLLMIAGWLALVLPRR